MGLWKRLTNRYSEQEEDYTGPDSFPHCDAMILHSPGACVYCDEHPTLQQSRIDGRVAFSDDKNPAAGLLPCPSTLTRTAEVRDLWHGNVAVKG